MRRGHSWVDGLWYDFSVQRRTRWQMGIQVYSYQYLLASCPILGPQSRSLFEAIGGQSMDSFVPWNNTANCEIHGKQKLVGRMKRNIWNWPWFFQLNHHFSIAWISFCKLLKNEMLFELHKMVTSIGILQIFVRSVRSKRSFLLYLQ